MKKTILISILALAFSACTSKQTPKEPTVKPLIVNTLSAGLTEIDLKVDGMTCDQCEITIKNSILNVSGIDSISANYEDSTLYLKFNPTKVKLIDITDAITSKGYIIKNLAIRKISIPEIK